MRANFRPERARDRPPQRGLADAGRTDEAEDRVLALGPDLLHGQILEDPLLDLVQPLVVLVQDPPRPDEVEMRRWSACFHGIATSQSM